ncbi:hypothetical protein [Bombilactobacillus mellis]|uniref:hypothetical protein n=1 Tax=Bombilactobacillus mellis TaxID=1218508 RepID=UPI00158035FA|nr:hypothetical protein [Bombilactobacillus mellis]NUF25669.1 hypothetical protein [Bombilactobacillus mellis]
MTFINNQQENSSKNSEPIGFIKFNDYPENLQNGEIFFSKESTFMYQKPPIGDPSEGYLKNKYYRINYKDIFSYYSKNTESYISCFTALYKSDFGNDGYIKKDTVDRLKKLDHYNKKRSAVIFPKDFDKLYLYDFYYFLNNFNKKLIDEYESDKKHNYALKPYYDLKTRFEDVTIKYKPVKYIDTELEENNEYLKEEDKEKLKNWKYLDKNLGKFEEYLDKCFFEKPKEIGKEKYYIQNEYRIVLTLFNTKKTTMPEHIKLKFNFENEGVKIFKHNELNKINIKNFNRHFTGGSTLENVKFIYK